MFNQHAGAVNTTPKTSLTTVDEVYAVVLDVEPHQVAAKDSLQHQVVPGEDLDHVPGGEGDVKKESYLARNIFLLCHLPDRGGCQHQVVVVDPDQGHIVRVLNMQMKYQLHSFIHLVYFTSVIQHTLCTLLSRDCKTKYDYKM